MIMNRMEGLQLLEQQRLIVISRGLSMQQLHPVADALWQGGIRILELTMNTVGAPAMIDKLQQDYHQHMFIGAGTVTTLYEAREAIAAGAQFLVSPHTDEALIHWAQEQQIPIFPGAYTPTEILRAWHAGATAVKIFPTGSRTYEYIQELQGPLNNIPMIAMGGIDAHNVTQYVELGCYALGIGSAILDKQAITEENYGAISARAKLMVEAIQTAKNVE
jgi:2-dehydro-3-deoxyphosphogluconate aldolase/(4S)-4-hydroxy-2-oxoglutarate aldolase